MHEPCIVLYYARVVAHYAGEYALCGRCILIRRQTDRRPDAFVLAVHARTQEDNRQYTKLFVMKVIRPRNGAPAC